MRVIKFFVLLCVLSCCAVFSALAATGDYYLDVTHGSGSGFYAAGTNVNVVANTAPAGEVFDEWAGSIDCIVDNNIDASNIMITVPQNDIVLIATYKAAPVSKYTLTVSGGTGSGTYDVGTEVPISANYPPAGKVFDQWSGDVGFINNFLASNTEIRVPQDNISVVALYKDAPKYTLTVSGGTGSGSYALGTGVDISANSPSYGKVFDQWTGDIGLVYDFYASSTKITIPEGNVSLTATYRNSNAVVYTLSVNNGNNSGTYYLGEKVTVKANTPPGGKIFDKWTGDTGNISSTSTSTIIVTIPDHGISLTATYKAAPTPAPTPTPAPHQSRHRILPQRQSTPMAPSSRPPLLPRCMSSLAGRRNGFPPPRFSSNWDTNGPVSGSSRMRNWIRFPTLRII